MERILLGFSGGVDSAMTAMLLRERGYDVHGAMMSVRDPSSGHGCGREGDADAARALAESIGIPLAVFDCSSEYRRHVLDYFRDEYLAGRTPNPCVMCNPMVKFRALPALAREAGIRFDRFATGHYARIRRCPETGQSRLFRGVDLSKDQSYFLYRLTPEQLAGTLFPLGDFHKREVRAMARERNLPVHDKPDSQDFYAGDYADLLGRPTMAGEIVDNGGRIRGRHDGYWRFTPGQRKGLGVASSHPLYVLRVEPHTNRVVVGTRSECECVGCRIDSLCFPGGPPEAGRRFLGRLRSAQALRPMWVEADEGDALRIRFKDPVHGVAPGQSLVCYDGERVLGGGFISGGFTDTLCLAKGETQP